MKVLINLPPEVFSHILSFFNLQNSPVDVSLLIRIFELKVQESNKIKITFNYFRTLSLLWKCLFVCMKWSFVTHFVVDLCWSLVNVKEGMENVVFWISFFYTFLLWIPLSWQRNPDFHFQFHLQLELSPLSLRSVHIRLLSRRE